MRNTICTQKRLQQFMSDSEITYQDILDRIERLFPGKFYLTEELSKTITRGLFKVNFGEKTSSEIIDRNIKFFISPKICFSFVKKLCLSEDTDTKIEVFENFRHTYEKHCNFYKINNFCKDKNWLINEWSPDSTTVF